MPATLVTPATPEMLRMRKMLTRERAAMSRKGHSLAAFGIWLLIAAACGGDGDGGNGSDSGTAQASGAGPQIPQPDIEQMEPRVEQRLRETREAVLANSLSADAWGRFGMVAHAHELWEEAVVAYGQAEKLDPSDVRWPYYLGDVLSVLGTDLEAATQALRRALALKPDYGPAHMRLGNVLLADGRQDEAATELERALDLEPDLEPARVALAQIRLSQGELPASAEMLEDILERSPRHGRALSTLAQVYMRQGRRDDAREVAERARDAANYNLFSDPLMGQVVAEGVSSVEVWERAKSFLEGGNYEQAALGLRQVVEVLPGNPEVHHQLAVAYGNLGETDRARHHLERTVALDPDRVEARIQLATVHLDGDSPAAALPHLRHALELAPDDPDAAWLLGKASVMSGDLRGGLASFERAEAAGLAVPVWAHNEWGSALAQTGRPDAALLHFQAALAAEPDNAQALFYVGLLLEGGGRIDEAVEHYCRSMRSQANPLAAGRLGAIGRTCGFNRL